MSHWQRAVLKEVVEGLAVLDVWWNRELKCQQTVLLVKYYMRSPTYLVSGYI